MTDQGVFEDQNGDQDDELHINDVSAYDDGTPRGGDTSHNQDGQQVYESMNDVHPAEDNRYTLGETTGAHLNQNDVTPGSEMLH